MPNQPPTVASPIAAQNAAVGQTFSVVIPASTFADDAGVSNLTLTVSGLPAGLSFNAGTKTISGTATTAGSSTVTVKATDVGNLSVSTILMLMISSCSGVDPYIVTGTYASSTPILLSAINQMQTDVVQPVSVNSNASLTLKAGQIIRLKPGFTVKPGGTLRAYIGPCN